MQGRPLVSVIIPVYNSEQYIAHALRSVFNQTYKNLELIIVDDGSTDNSMQVVSEVLAGRDVIAKIVKQSNCGQGAARNSGFKASNGEWIFYLDADDLIPDCAIEHLLEAAINQNADLVFGKFQEISNIQEADVHIAKGTVTSFTPQQIQKAFLTRKNIILTPGTLYSKAFLSNHGIAFKEIRWSEDQRYIWQVLRYVNKVAMCDETVYFYLQHQGSIMNSTARDLIISGYHSVEELNELYKDIPDIGRYIVPRWVLGSLNSAARYMDYADWAKLSDSVNGKDNLKSLRTFPDMRVRVMAIIGTISPKAFYMINRRR